MSFTTMRPMTLDTLEESQEFLGVSPATVAGIHTILRTEKFKPQFSGSSGPSGLDALAFLASEMKQVATPEPELSTSDEVAMPPPPPRRRNRSVSNPEGMEKWNRRHFVLPASIIEEELAEAKAATEAKQAEDREREEQRRIKQEALVSSSVVRRKRYSPVSVVSPTENGTEDGIPASELLKKARSRLLEDLSQGKLSGTKNKPALPHTLDKYKEVYNQNGRVGIYTPSERKAIIARYQDKRGRRVWRKKIRYNCRKNLADRRLRVKGRFVKREEPVLDLSNEDAGFVPTAQLPYRRRRRHTIT